MTYTVQQLATLADITTRTLHHYDAIGLLKPVRNAKNGYRQYGEAELLKLQQIMFFRELEFPLEEIKHILADPHFDLTAALADHRKLIEIKKKRMNDLLKTIDKTIKKINKEKTMHDKELYGGFTKEEYEAYSKEAKERWGDTDAFKQSVGKYEKLTKEERAAMQKAGDDLLKEIVANMSSGAESPEVQALIAKHYDGLRFFYEPNPELYRGLANMYVDDPRFAATFKKYHPDLPEFMRDAMHVYCNTLA